MMMDQFKWKQNLLYGNFQTRFMEMQAKCTWMKKGIQYFICLTAEQVTIDGVTTACQPNKKIPVYHRVVHNNVSYLVQSHHFIEQNLQRAVMNDSLLEYIGHIWEKDYNVTEEEGPDIQYVQIKT